MSGNATIKQTHSEWGLTDWELTGAGDQLEVWLPDGRHIKLRRAEGARWFSGAFPVSGIIKFSTGAELPVNMGGGIHIDDVEEMAPC